MSTKAPIAEKEEFYHEDGLERRYDPYHWLRDKSWPDVKSEKVLEYIKRENEYANQFFDSNKDLMDVLYNEMLGRIKEDDQSYHVQKDNYFYYSRINKGQNYHISCRKFGSMQGEELVLLDPNELSKGYPAFDIGDITVSPDHKLLAYSYDLIGEEKYTIVIKDLQTNKLYDDKVENTSGTVVWHENQEGFFYNLLDENHRSKTVYYHKLGTNSSDDVLVYKESDVTFSVGIDKSSDKRYLFIFCSSATENEILFLDLKSSSFGVQKFLSRSKDIKYSLDTREGDFFVKINDKGKNFRLIKTNIENKNTPQKWQEIIPHSNDEYLKGFDLAQKYFVVNRKIKGINHITMFDYSGNIKQIKFDEDSYASVGYFPTYESELLRMSYSSMTTPASILEYDFITEEMYTRKTQQIPSGYERGNYQSERVYAKSRDGVEVPISLVYNKNKFQKNAPLLLYGYGSYGHAISPSFSSNVISLLDRGFVFAIAHIRGGDDLGYEWYESAKFLNKKRTFNDFIDCAEYLIKKNYTSADKLSIMGGSAGGMLVGVVMNERPDLFKSVVAMVPFVDVLNTMLDENLPLTPGEYKEWGNPKEKEYYEYIRSYSPYDNVTEQHYPRLFVTAGISDPRVTYWEPAKWVAKIRVCNKSNNDVIFLTEMDTGHQGQSGRYDALKELARIYTFLLQ